MSYQFEYEKAFLCVVAFVIVALLVVRVRLARRRGQRRAPGGPEGLF